jgi:hypothetical protein
MTRNNVSREQTELHRIPMAFYLVLALTVSAIYSECAFIYQSRHQQETRIRQQRIICVYMLRKGKLDNLIPEIRVLSCQGLRLPSGFITNINAS